MPDFLQLNAKGKETGGLFSLIRAEPQQTPDGGGIDSRASANPLKDTIDAWLAEEDRLTDFRLRGTPIKPEAFVDAITSTVNERVCLIAGHVWIEWIEHAGDVEVIHGWAHADIDRLDLVNVDVAEFLPTRIFKPDAVCKALQTDGGLIEWANITDEQLRKLFADLFKAPANASLIIIPGRDPMGFVPGQVKLLTRDSLHKRSESWLKSWLVDRRNAYVTPAWNVRGPGEIMKDFVVRSVDWKYSFTPEHYPPPPPTENCATWAALALDETVGEEWLETLSLQCDIEKDTLDECGCGPYDVRGRGWMKCVLVYCRKADEKRSIAGLKRFD